MGEQDRFLTKREVSKMTTRSSTSLWRGCKEGTFPLPRRVGKSRIAWLFSDIQNWMNSRPNVDQS